jgi:AraC family transcriptional regulator
MKRPSNIPLLRTTNDEVLPDAASRVVLSSTRANWHNLVLEEHHFPNRDLELNDFMFLQHVVVLNIGRPIGCEFKKDGRLQHISSKASGAISLFPSRQPFFRRMKKHEIGSAHLLYLALDPVFVSQTAEALEVYPDRVELVEQHGDTTDPAILHLALALRAGVQGAGAGDRMYGESLSTALTVRMLREYGGIAVDLQHADRGLSREKLMRAIEYIQDQLHTGLTVSGIARSVNMSPYHFTRLFKTSTGQSPYRYVIEARARKAKELLASGKLSIAEVAYDVGFADQSHLTRHLKQLLGVTPKMLLHSRHMKHDRSR